MRRLLRGGVKGVQIAFVFHQLIKPPLLYDTALFQDQDLVVAPQEGFIQGVGDHDPGQALQIQDGAGHLEGGLGVQGRGGLVYQQDLGVFQQAPGDGDPLLLPAGRSAAVFAAAQVFPTLGDERGQAGQFDGPVDPRFGKLRDHGDIVPDGGVENEHILPDHRHQIIQRLAADLPQFVAVIGDLAGIGAVASRRVLLPLPEIPTMA